MELKCGGCGAELTDDMLELSKAPCSACGSTVRQMTETLTASAVGYSLIRGIGKRPSLPSDQKLRFDIKSGHEMSHKLGRMVKVERTIDKDADLYVERISDPQTGEIIHECIEKLSEHTRHGSAKKKV